MSGGSALAFRRPAFYPGWSWNVAPPVGRVAGGGRGYQGVERTGNYHLPILRAFAAARWQGRKFDTRVVHPFATQQHRQPANPGDKTDDHDLAALFRATVAGFGLLEPAWDELHRQLQLLARHRCDLVQKLVRQLASSSEFSQCGLQGLRTILNTAKVRFHEKMLEKIVAWAANAAEADP